MLQRDTGIPTKVFNDLDSVLLHECWFGDAIGVPRFAVITMGAGVGYSISDHGDPIDNPDKSYGLAGHVLIDPEAALLLRAYRLLAMPDVRLDRRGIPGIMGRVTTFEEFSHDLRANRPQARRLAERTCYRLGVLVATVSNLAMPSRVLVSGKARSLRRRTASSFARASMPTGTARPRRSNSRFRGSAGGCGRIPPPPAPSPPTLASEGAAAMACYTRVTLNSTALAG